MNWWFKRHPELLISECNKLQSNSNYREHERRRNNILISVGEIIVRLEETKKFPVAIIYSESTPYTLPYVIPLQKLITEVEIEKLSNMNSLEAITQLNVNAHVKFLNFWHQNPNGTICLLEADNLEKYGEFFSAREVINRIRDWLAGTSTGKLPSDGPEVELFAHFRKKDDSKEFLIPSKYLQEPLFQGEFYCTQLARVFSGPNGDERIIYLGSFIMGENDKGIRIGPISLNEHTHLLPPGFNSELDLILKPELLNRVISSGLLIEGFWWDTYKEVKPIQTITDFVEQVGNGDIDNGVQRIKKLIGDTIFSQSRDEILVGIRFPNKRQEAQWQNFMLKKSELMDPPIVGDKSSNAFKSQILNNYSLYAIRTSEFSDVKQHLRNFGRTQRNILKEKTVNAIGCGALGSEVADTLSKAGVGILCLVDNDRLKIENCIRHVLGADSIGMLKVDGLRRHIKFHNPFTDVYTKPSNIEFNNIVEYFLDPGIGVSTIANDSIEGFLNEQALIYNKVIFYGRALRGGKAARIFRVIPGKDACFYCLNLYLDLGDEIVTKIPIDETLPTITNECNNPIRPASAADLKFISSLLAQVIIDYLQGVDQINNHWIWSTEKIPGINEEKISAYSLKGSNIPVHPRCPYCQKVEKFSVEISRASLEFMNQETKKDPSIETGGVLLGEIMSHRLVVTHASEPGPKAIKQPSRFLKDKEYCQKYIDEMYSKDGETAVYIGEWHFHPTRSNKPSNTDFISLGNIANGKGYLTENPTMIILSHEGKPSCTIHPTRHPYYYSELIIKN